MKNTKSNIAMKIFLYLMLAIIILPIFILLVWTFTGQWPWPNLLPKTFSLRATREILAPHSKVFPTLLSSMVLSLIVALLSATVATMTARALVGYSFMGKGIIELIALAPNLVPSTVFAMGVHVVFIRMGLADRPLGVILVHLIYTLPYSINIMRDLTYSIGMDMEIQAQVLGVAPAKAFFHVSLPLLMPGILASLTMAYITSFSQYFLTLLIGGGEVKTFSVLMLPLINKGDRSLSSAYALVFILSSLLVFKLMDGILKAFFYNNKGRKL